MEPPASRRGPWLTRRTAALLTCLPVVWALVGLAGLSMAPYTGAQFERQQERWFLVGTSVATPSQELKPWMGRALTSLAGQPVGPDSLVLDPDEVREGGRLAAYWGFQEALSAAAVPGQPLVLGFDHPEGSQLVTIVPQGFPLWLALERYGPYVAVGLFPLLIGLFLVTKRPDDERAQVFFLLGLWVALFAASYGATASRETAFPFALQSLGRWTNAIAAPLAYLFALVFGLVFPRRRRLLDWKPLPWVLAVATVAVVALFQLRISYDVRLAFFVVCRAVGGLLILQALFTAKSNLERAQTLWVVVALGIAALPYGFAVLARALGWSQVSVGLGVPVFFFLALPVAILIAVGRYRLMEIDGLVGSLLVSVPTLAILVALDWALLAWLGQVFPAGTGTLGLAFALWAALALYLPLRRALDKAVDGLLGRSPLVLEEVLVRLGDRLISAGPGEVLASGGAFVGSLWGIRAETRSVDAPSALHEGARGLTAPRHLYEVPGVTVDESRGSGLLVPLVSTNGYLGYWEVLPKPNRRLYSTKEIRICEALALIASRAHEVYLTREDARREKERLSRELHDGVGSSVSNAVLTLDLVLRDRESLPDGSSGRKRLTTLRDNLVANLSEVRDLVWGMEEADGSLDGLVDHWRDKVQRFFRAVGLVHRVEVSLAGQGVLSAGGRLAVIRVTQECLTNVLVHSQASRVDLSLATDASGLSLTVADDGRGFDSSRGRSGYGLRNMEARARDLGGVLEIDSAPGQGTRISLRIPWSPGS